MRSLPATIARAAVATAFWMCVVPMALADHVPGEPPYGPVTICFLGDTATGLNWPPFTAPRFAGTGRPFTILVHQLCKDAGADAIVHSGDLDYVQDAPGFEAFINEQMGPDFPYFFVLGNHEYEQTWLPPLYKANLTARLERLGITWLGDIAEQYAFDWRGLRFILTTPGAETAGRARSPYFDPAVAGAFIREHATSSPSPWVIAAWHMNQHMLQTGTKLDTAGWPPYEESRLAGATIWTAHEHTYSRTHLLSDMTTQEVAADTSPYTIAPGLSLVVVTGTAGAALRTASPHAYLPYWASVYTLAEGARYGATICTFGAGGIFTRADCVFRNIDNVDIDRWTMFSERGDRTGPVIQASIIGPSGTNGWYTGDVTVSWSVTDPESGIVASAGCDAVTLSAETPGTDVACSARNGVGILASETAVIKIDKTAPDVSCPATPNTLWPPQHQLVAVSVDVEVTDALSGPGPFRLTATASTESGTTDIVDFSIGGADTSGFLRAERLGTENGRVYNLAYTAVDQAGNSASCVASVNVPHDRGL